MRVHELAKELGCSSKELIAKLHDLGVEAKSHMSTLDETAVELMQADMAPAASPDPVPEQPPAPPATAPEPKAEVTPAPKAKAASPKKETGPAETKEAGSGEIVVDDKTLRVRGPVVVKDLAEALNLRPNQLIASLMGMNVLATINQRLDVNVARKLAEAHGFSLEHEKKAAEYQHAQRNRQVEEVEEDRPEDMMPRPPVVTFLGHVDHGKTSLLDRIRDTTVVDGESGGITQHIGAYTVDLSGRQITFLDTPGHAAFTAMRARGANMTDIAVIIIAADDGVMPQTKEAIRHAKAAGVSVMVAMNKMDLPAANPDTVKQQLQAEDLAPEDWGGETICVPVSAETGEGVNQLLEMILLQAEVLELKANPNCRGEGYVIEAQLEPGMGPTANLLVTRGTLNVGDTVLCDAYHGKIRALINDHGVKIKSAGPSTPVKCLGLSGVPEAGAEFKVYANEKLARTLAQDVATRSKGEQLDTGPKTSLDDLFSQLEENEKIQLKVILKADTQGSVEAIAESLMDIKSEKISLDIILRSTGNISENDIMLASASNAVVLGFHVAKEPGVDARAKHEGVDVRLHQVIYELFDEVRDAMLGLLAPELKEKVTGRALIKQLFSVGKRTVVAGCLVTSGRLSAKARVRVIRADEVLYEGGVESLRHFQDEVPEVRESQECGIRVSGYSDFEEGDILEFYEIEELARAL